MGNDCVHGENRPPIQSWEWQSRTLLLGSIPELITAIALLALLAAIVREYAIPLLKGCVRHQHTVLQKLDSALLTLSTAALIRQVLLPPVGRRASISLKLQSASCRLRRVPEASVWPFIGDTARVFSHGERLMNERFKQHGSIFTTWVLGKRTTVVGSFESMRMLLNMEHDLVEGALSR